MLLPLLLYYGWVSAQRDYFTGRNLRLLAVMSDQVESRIDLLAAVLRGAATQASRGETHYFKQFLRESVPEVSPADPSPEKAATTSCEDTRLRPLVAVSRKENQSILRFEIACSGHSFAAEASLEALIAPFVREGVFGDVLLAEADSRVLFQYAPSGARIERLDALLEGRTAEPKQAPQWATLRRFGSTADVEIAGAAYKLFLQPVALALKAKPEDPHTVEWALCGVTRGSDFLAGSMAISYQIIAWFTFLVIAMFLGWPFLKAAFMNHRERLRISDALFMVLATPIGVCLLTLLALNTYHDHVLQVETHDQLEELAGAVNRNLVQELRDIRAQMEAFNQRLSSGLARQGNILADPKLFNHPADPYPYLESVWWTNQQGLQVRKWAVRSQPTQSIPVAARGYFTNLKAGRHWRLDDREFQLEPIYSWTTGENTAVYMMRMPDGSDYWSAAITTRLLSVMQPLLPPGYGYAIIGSDGKVLFHSDVRRNLKENFFDDLDEDDELLPAVFARAAVRFSSHYLGRGHRLYAAPVVGIENLAWTLVVFRDSTLLRSLDLEVLALALSLLFVYGVVFVLAAAVVHYLPPKVGADWLWPRREMAGGYRHLSCAYALMLLASLPWLFGAGPLEILAWVACAPAAAVAMAFTRLGGGETAGGWKRRAGEVAPALLPALLAAWLLVFSPRPWWVSLLLCATLAAAGTSCCWAAVRRFFDGACVPRYHAVYVWARVLLLSLVATAPCIGFFTLACDHELELLIKHGHLLMARSAEERARRIVGEYREVTIPEREKTRLLEGMLALVKARDAYPEALSHTTLKASPEKVPGDNGGAAAGIRQSAERAIRGALTGIRRPYDQVAWETGGLAEDQPLDGRWKWETDKEGNLKLLYPYRFDGYQRLEVSSRLPRLRPPNDPLGWGLLLALLVAPWPCLRFMARRVFLLDVEEPAPLKETALDPCEPVTRNLLVLGEPCSGKSAQLSKRSNIHTVNLAAVAVAARWEEALTEARESRAEVVALDHFEYQIEGAECSRRKLHLLEQLRYADKRTVVILSTVDPLYYFTSGGAGDAPSETGRTSGSEREGAPLSLPEVDRWAGVLSSFEKLHYAEHRDGDFERAMDEFSAKVAPDGEPRRVLERECSGTSRLRAIGREFAESVPEGASYTEEQIVGEILHRAEAYYRAVWATCSQNEKLLLIQLAQDGLANVKSRAARDQLRWKGLIRLRPRIRVMNESFRRFVLSAQHPEEVSQWEKEGAAAGWNAPRTALLILALFLVTFL
ncbi:MAG: hypothetical protein FJW34_01090, partial [Acidobacteria bacterium]|nr:hypothetical protein [Acidobacteriota bacterium]